MTRGLAIALVAIAVAAATARAQLRYETLEFPELLRAHADANIGWNNMPTVAFGDRIVEPAVYVTANKSRVQVYGHTVVSLSSGRAADGDIARCASGAPCLPRVRNAIERARADLARELKTVPKVILLVDRTLPYGTLLLVARSAAEAGAQLSTVIAARRGPEIVGLPVWMAPGRKLLLSTATDPTLITVELDNRAMTVRTADTRLGGGYLARDMADLLDTLGRLELATGRTTYFVAGAPLTPSGDVIGLIAAARDIFPHAVLAGRGEQRAVIR